MLKQLRDKKTARKIWIGLAVIIIPAFTLWGTGNLMRNRQEEGTVGRIDGRRVSPQEYKDAMDASRNLMIMQFGESYTDMKEYMSLESQAWERLLLLNEARRRSIRVNNKEIIEAIARNPAFQRNEAFNERTYQEIMTYVFHTQPRIFEEQTRQNLMISKLFKALTENLTVTDEEIKNEYIKQNDEISVDYLAAIPADFAKTVTPQDEELKAYFDKNPVQFKQPPSYNLAYVTLETQNRLQEVANSLNKHKDIAQVAKDYGLLLKETGTFLQNEAIPGIGWSPEIMSYISRLKIGQASMPVKSDKSYYIFVVKDRKEAYIPQFEQAKSRVREAFIKEESERISREKIESCKSEVIKSAQEDREKADFEKLARKYALKSGSTNAFKFGSYIENIGASDPFWTAALKLKENEISDIIPSSTGLYIVKVKKQTPFDEDKFAKEKPEFSKKVLLQKKNEYFAQYINDLKKRSQ